MFMLQTNWLGDILLVVCKRWRKKDIPNIYTKLLYLFIYLSNMSGQALIPIRLIRLCRFDYINGWRTREDIVYGMKYSIVAQLSVGNLIIEVARGSFREYYTYFVWHSWTVVRFRNTYINIYIYIGRNFSFIVIGMVWVLADVVYNGQCREYLSWSVWAYIYFIDCLIIESACWGHGKYFVGHLGLG